MRLQICPHKTFLETKFATDGTDRDLNFGDSPGFGGWIQGLNLQPCLKRLFPKRTCFFQEAPIFRFHLSFCPRCMGFLEAHSYIAMVVQNFCS